MQELSLLARHLLVSALTGALIVGPAAPYAFAGPNQIGNNCSATGCGVDHDDGSKQWTVNAHDGAIFRYSSFNVAADETVRFNGLDNGADVRVLNRILSALPSQIDGSITQSGGNIHVYLVNPAGIVFGNGATVNVTQLQAAAGRLSERDFTNGDDRYTAVRGPVTNAGQITANAVALVGGTVENSGKIDASAADGGWIVLAAGRDVFIGRDDSNRGILLRVEGGAGAVVNPAATGVKNTGTLTTGSAADPANTGKISIGAGDLYGRAIFSKGAIEARELALQADNKGDIALAGSIKADTVDVTVAGANPGELRGATSAELNKEDPSDHTPPGTLQTIDANRINLTATDAKGSVKVGDLIGFRDTAGNLGTPLVVVTQSAELLTSNLKGLNLGDVPSHTQLSLNSTDKAVTVDDKSVVAGTQLALTGRSIQLLGTDTLNVFNLQLNATTTLSDGDIVATGGDIQAPTNLFFFTKPGAKKDPTQNILLSAHEGTINVAGDIVTSNGGGLKIEGRDLIVGSVDPTTNGIRSGNVQSSGGIQSKVDIGFTDSNGVQQTQSVTLNGINTNGLKQNEKDPEVAGGDITVNAVGPVIIRGAVTANGEVGPNKSTPDLEGGNVTINSGSTLQVGGITTGGANAPSSGNPLRGTIALTGTEITTSGNITAASTPTGNDQGQRDRDVTIDGNLVLGAAQIQLAGGNVTVTGSTRTGLTSPTDGSAPAPIASALTIASSGKTEVGAIGNGVESIAIHSRAGDVVTHGDLAAAAGVSVTWDTAGTGRWLTGNPAGQGITVSSTQVSVAAHESTDTKATTANATIDPDIHFSLSEGIPNPSDPTQANTPPTFHFEQDAAIGTGTTAGLFVPGRFSTAGVLPLTVTLKSKDAVALDGDARGALAGTDLSIQGASFSAPVGGPDFNVSSFALSVDQALTVDFNVTASKAIAINSGANGSGGALTVRSTLSSDSISLASSDGTGGNKNGEVFFAPTAALRDSHGDAAKQVTITQDADLTTAPPTDPGTLPSVPLASIYGTPSDPANYVLDLGLESLDGKLTLTQDLPSQIAPHTALTLIGTNGIDLGGSLPTLVSLSATTKGDLVVATNVTTEVRDVPNTDPTTGTHREGGQITLHAGSDGSGNLTIASTLVGGEIDLLAGSLAGGSSSSRVILNDGTHFASSSPDTQITTFTLDQDASIDSSSTATQIPDRSLFTGLAPNVALQLGSHGGSITISGNSLVDGSQLTLVSADGSALVDDNLSVASLDITGTSTIKGNISSAGAVAFHTGAVSFAPDNPTADSVQFVHAGGDLTSDSAITKPGDGSLELTSGGVLTVTDVSTSHLVNSPNNDTHKVGSIVLSGATSVTAGNVSSGSASAINASGDITVTSGGDVVIKSLDAKGADGLAPTRNADATNGSDGGTVTVIVNGADPTHTISIGGVRAVGGAGGTPTTDRPTLSQGGKGGSITLSAPGGIALSGDLLADGGLGGTPDATAQPAIRAASGDVLVTGGGPLRLGASSETANGDNDAATNEIHGDSVRIEGPVVVGSDANGVAIPAAFTGFGVVAGRELFLGGDVTAGRVDLELHQGTLAPAPGQPIHLNADTIRLAASDGAGGQTTGVVDLSDFIFHGSDGAGPVKSVTLEQDLGFGAAVGGSAIPSLSLFVSPADRTPDFGFGLVSYDGAIALGAGDVDNVQDTNLVLAANGAPRAPVPIQLAGGLEATSLTLGTTTVLGTVGGTAHVTGDLLTGTGGSFANGLVTNGDLTVDGALTNLGTSTFNGTTTQTVKAHSLELDGFQNAKNTTGDLVLDSKNITFGDGTQTIGASLGALHLTSALFKASGDLVLGGATTDATQPAVVVDQPAGQKVAIQTLDGDIVINAGTQPTSNTSGPGVGTYQLGGDVLATGNITLNGKAILQGSGGSYAIQALRKSDGTGGQVSMGGISSADGDVTLHGQGPLPSLAAPQPSGVQLGGEFDLVHSLLVDGVTELTADTKVVGGSLADVTFLGPIQGAGGLDLKTGGLVTVGDDVALTGGGFAVGGDRGVRFTSDDDVQTIQAKSVSLGNGAASPADGATSITRIDPEPIATNPDGTPLYRAVDLVLDATSGSVTVARGQRMVVNGDLTADATGAVTLADTAALKLRVNAKDLVVHGGATVVANSIQTNVAPRVNGGGGVTFATPSGQEVSDNVPSDQVLVRSIGNGGRPLNVNDLLNTANDPVTAEFPNVDGAAVFDYARQIPRFDPRVSITRPRADLIALSDAVEARPLWAEELISYLDMRSLETPDTTGKPPEAERLPPVGARPGEPIAETDARVRSAAIENAVALYRELFRPEMKRDGETGVIQSPTHDAEIRAAFQAPVDSLRRARHGQEVAGAEVAKLIEAEPKYGDARRYREQLGALLDVGSRALSPDQQPRFRKLLLAEVTPFGINPAEFSSLFQ
ncbi:MAG TPA: filamentous hemagglutinin N-terminal domain-containing protein [Myxococcota bacterium]|nr:filamentous hemagglutinin N-terminal domain-containing protein [Myxococcota bacterium]